MPGWAETFLTIALAPAAFGLGDLLAASAGIARIIVFVFGALFAIALAARLLGRGGRWRT